MRAAKRRGKKAMKFAYTAHIHDIRIDVDAFLRKKRRPSEIKALIAFTRKPKVEREIKKKNVILFVVPKSISSPFGSNLLFVLLLLLYKIFTRFHVHAKQLTSSLDK